MSSDAPSTDLSSSQPSLSLESSSSRTDLRQVVRQSASDETADESWLNQLLQDIVGKDGDSGSQHSYLIVYEETFDLLEFIMKDEE